MTAASASHYLDPAADALLARVPAPRRALFLDRDGVVNTNHGYVHRPDQTDWIPGIFELCRMARNTGWLPIVVTNQAGIARGYYTVEQFLDYTRWVHAEFACRGVSLLATFYCPHHPDAGLAEWRRDCDCRKPRPGMLWQAATEFDIDLGASCLVGDSRSDLEAAGVAGLARCALLGPPGAQDATIHNLEQAQAWFLAGAD